MSPDYSEISNSFNKMTSIYQARKYEAEISEKRDMPSGPRRIRETENARKRTNKHLTKAKSFRCKVSTNVESSTVDLDEERVALERQFGVLQEVVDGAGAFVENVTDVADALRIIESTVANARRALVMQEDDTFAETMVSRLEALLVFVYSLSTVSRAQDMIPLFVLYLKTWGPNKSVYGTIMRWAKTWIDTTAALVAEDESLHLQSGQWFTNNWKSVTQGPLGIGVGSLLTIAVMSGMAPDKLEDGMLNDIYKSLPFNPAMASKKGTVLEFVFRTLDWVTDSVIPAIDKRDWSLMLTDSDTAKLDEAYRATVDMVNRSIAGQMDFIETTYGVGSEAEIYTYLVKTCEAHKSYAAKLPKDDPRRKEVLVRLMRLDKISSDYTATWHEKGLREKPFAFFMRGGTSVGKSTAAGIVAHAICAANRLPEGKEYRCALNGNDKYQSEFKSQHVYVLFDDVGNSKPEVNDNDPISLVIQFINNVHCAALNAEADKKGKNDIRCKIVGMTTNTVDIHAGYYSVNPASVMRRFDLVIDVALKADAVGPNGGLHSKFAGDSQPDAWEFTLYTVQVVRSEKDFTADKWFLKPVFGELGKPQAVSIVELLDYLENETPKFYEFQRKIVEASDELHKKEHCEFHPLFTLPCKKCQVVPEDKFIPLDKQAGVKRQLPELDVFFIDPSLYDASDTVDETDVIETQLNPAQRVARIARESVANLAGLTKKVRETVKRHPYVAALGVVACIGVAGFTLFGRKEEMQQESGVIARIERAAKDPKALIAKQNVYQRVFTNRLAWPKGSVSTTLEAFERRIDCAMYHIETQLIDEETREGVGAINWANAYPVGSCCWATVGHLFPRSKSSVRVRFRISPGVGTKNVVVMMNSASLFFHPTKDLVVMYVPQMGDNINLAKYMPGPDFELDVGSPLFVYHNHKSQALHAEDWIEPSRYKATTKVDKIGMVAINGGGDQHLLSYTADNHDGMCGSLVVLASRNPTIVGMHVAGKNDTKRCAAVLLDADFFDIAKKHFGGVLVKESSALPAQVMGRDISFSNEVHPKSAVHYIESENTSVQVFGQHDQPLSKFKSDVIVSPMAQLVEREFGVERLHFAPQREAARPSFHKFLTRGSVSEDHKIVNPKYVALARDDFMTKITPYIPRIRDYVHTISFYDALNGVPSEKGFEPVNPTSSVGWPLNCPKWKLLAHCELAEELGLDTVRFVRKVEVDGHVQYVYELNFDKEMYDVERHVDEMLQSWADGFRHNVIFRCNLKDEPVTKKKIDAKKIRVFTGAPLHYVIATRMILLAKFNVMKCFPTVFECAVGVNATGRDWAFMVDYLTKFGDSHCGDGDYAAFDQTIDPSFGKATADVWRWILEECGFDEEILSLFDGVATEFLYPIFEMDGLVFSGLSQSPSGVSGTVEWNSGKNALLTRYCYYAANRDVVRAPLYHEVVSNLTYGDDLVMNFNIPAMEANGIEFGMATLSQELRRIGIEFTNASKEVHTVQHKPLSECTFLKRTFGRHPQLGEYVGALEEASIFKSLTMSKKPKRGQKESLAEICAGNLNNALREFYWHGEDKYDEALPKILAIAAEAVDFEGHKVKDYFVPVTKDEIKASFLSTWCSYDAAMAVLTEEPLDRQSGTAVPVLPDILQNDKLQYITVPSQYVEFPGQSFKAVVRTMQVNLDAVVPVVNNPAQFNVPQERLADMQNVVQVLSGVIEAFKVAEEERLQHELIVRSTARACAKMVHTSGIHVDDYGGMFDQDHIHFGDYVVMIDISMTNCILPRMYSFIEEYIKWCSEDQYVELETPQHMTLIVPLLYAYNNAMDCKYYGPRAPIRAFHLLSALADVLGNPEEPIWFGDTFIFGPLPHCTAQQILTRMGDLYDYIEADWWQTRVLRGNDVEVVRRSVNGTTCRANVQLSTVISRELDELEFELGHQCVFPRLMNLYKEVLVLEATCAMDNLPSSITLPASQA